VTTRQSYLYQEESDFPDRLRNALNQANMRPQPWRARQPCLQDLSIMLMLRAPSEAG